MEGADRSLNYFSRFYFSHLFFAFETPPNIHARTRWVARGRARVILYLPSLCLSADLPASYFLYLVHISLVFLSFFRLSVSFISFSTRTSLAKNACTRSLAQLLWRLGAEPLTSGFDDHRFSLIIIIIIVIIAIARRRAKSLYKNFSQFVIPLFIFVCWLLIFFF